MNTNISALADRGILLLEDDALISLDTADALTALGAQVFVAHTLDEAEALVARERIDAAVLDFVIGPARSDDLARRLIESRIPVVIASGFGNGEAGLSDVLQGVPTVDKPYSPQALYAALASVLATPPEPGPDGALPHGDRFSGEPSALS